jgi:hypothetical protein
MGSNMRQPRPSAEMKGGVRERADVEDRNRRVGLERCGAVIPYRGASKGAPWSARYRWIFSNK